MAPTAVARTDSMNTCIVDLRLAHGTSAARVGIVAPARSNGVRAISVFGEGFATRAVRVAGAHVFGEGRRRSA